MNSSKKIGVLGGGQLGRMLIQKAIDYNIEFDVMDPDPNAPCKNLAARFKVGDLKKFEDVIDFGKDLDIITIEIEKVNAEALAVLEKQGKLVYPQARVIQLIQDKRAQKKFYIENSIPTSEYALVQSNEEIKKHPEMIPGFHKLAKDGYDGRGVQKITTKRDISKSFSEPGLIEKAVDLEKEISCIVSRNANGDIKSFPLVEMVFHPEANLVDYLLSPANVSQEIENKAESLAIKIIEKLDMVGILAVEMFLTKTGDILVNEMAPRTHNSGHQSIESNESSQFEQHLRSILNWPPGSTDIRVPSAMVNLLGADGHTGEAIYEGMDKILQVSGVHIHLYGKKITKPFRKMGHITITDEDAGSLKEKIKFVKENFRIIA
ncbi:5-(carboxyamino)imidazole ribonucleotide synthase [Hyphobacterium sp. CCMP332]|nr:5-(carboxyamino)imidazole ribonucleotide synthase [Hyphobacterium sp. CCMP332]